MITNLFARLEKIKDTWFVLIVSIIFFFLRLPSLFEPYWYGDEGIYQTIGIALRQGRVLYEGIWDNKPPLLYILYAIFNGDQFTLRFVSLLFGIAAIIAFFLLAKRLFLLGNIPTKAHYIATLLFAFLCGIPLIEGNIANAENFMLFLNILSGLFVVSTITNRSNQQVSLRPLFIAGIILGLSFLFKVVAIFDFAAFFFFLAFVTFSQKEYLQKIRQKLLPFALGFLVPFLFSFLFFFVQGNGTPFLQASFIQNVGYVGYGNKLIIPQGLLLLKLLLLGITVGFLFVKRMHFTKTTVFIFLWLVFSLFSAFFSQRPYTHYLLVLLPAFCLSIGLLFQESRLRKFLLVIIFMIIVLIAPQSWFFKGKINTISEHFQIPYFWFYGKPISYYGNFISFITGQKTVENYYAFFDKATPRDYVLAQYITMHTKKQDTIFIWGNNAQLYKLTNKIPPGRYTVAYHMTSTKESIEETMDALTKGKPRLIISMPNQPPFPYPLQNYALRLIIDDVTIYERIP